MARHVAVSSSLEEQALKIKNKNFFFYFLYFFRIMARHVAVSSSLEERALSNEKPAGHKQPVLRQVLFKGKL